MDVSEAEQAHLHERLVQAIGPEATRTMTATLATKDDVATATQELQAAIANCATKQDLERFATKQDLERFATKDEVSELRTDVRELRTEVISLSTRVGEALVAMANVRVELKDDLHHYIGRQSMVQIGAMVSVVVAALTLAYAIVAGATP